MRKGSLNLLGGLAANHMVLFPAQELQQHQN